MSTSKTLLVDVVAASKKYRPSKAYTVVVDGKTSIGFEVKKVDSLPETGETKYLYLVPKEGSGDDTCDEYVWALKDADTYSWEHIGSTDVTIEVDDELSTTSENPVQNKVIAQAIGNIEQVLHTLNNGEES